ncbi:aspartyl protease family protein [Pedobacter hiemivivus]
MTTNVVLCHAQKTIELKSYQENLHTVDVCIEGKKYNFLFDSGGAETIISPEIANKLGKKIYRHSVLPSHQQRMFRMLNQIQTIQKHSVNLGNSQSVVKF